MTDFVWSACQDCGKETDLLKIDIEPPFVVDMHTGNDEPDSDSVVRLEVVCLFCGIKRGYDPAKITTGGVPDGTR